MGRRTSQLEKAADAVAKATDDRSLLIRVGDEWLLTTTRPTAEVETSEVRIAGERYRIRRSLVEVVVLGRAGDLAGVTAAAKALPDQPAEHESVFEMKKIGGKRTSAKSRDDLSEQELKEIRKFLNPTVSKKFKLTLINGVSGKQVSVDLRPKLTKLSLEKEPVWAPSAFHYSKSMWVYDLAGVIREAAESIDINVDRAVAWRGIFPMEPQWEMRKVHVGSTLQDKRLLQTSSLMRIAGQEILRSYPWAGTIMAPRDDRSQRHPVDQAWEDFGIRMDSEGGIRERVIRFTPRANDMRIFDRLQTAASKLDGKCIGLGITGVATGETGWGVFLCDQTGRALRELGADYSLSMALMDASVRLGIESPPVETKALAG